MKRAASKKTAKTVDKYELLAKALSADGLEVEITVDGEAYYDAVFSFADTLLNIRSFCQE
jgi:hypothetical protein